MLESLPNPLDTPLGWGLLSSHGAKESKIPLAVNAATRGYLPFQGEGSYGDGGVDGDDGGGLLREEDLVLLVLAAVLGLLGRQILHARARLGRVQM